MVASLPFIICLTYLIIHYRESENKTGRLQIVVFILIIPSFFLMLLSNKETFGLVQQQKTSQANISIGNTYVVDKVSFFSSEEQNMIEAIELLQSDADRRDELEKMKWSGKILLMPKGVHVQILSENNHLYKVKILDGFYKNNIAYFNWTSLGI